MKNLIIYDEFVIPTILAAEQHVMTFSLDTHRCNQSKESILFTAPHA